MSIYYQDAPIPPTEDWEATAALAAIATQPDRDTLADMLGLQATPPAEPPRTRGRALPRRGGGRRAVQG